MTANRYQRTLLQRRAFLVMVLLFIRSSDAWIFRPLEQIQKDYLALTRRVTARHILLPPKSEQVCLTLKQKIREAAETKYLVDAFEQAARQYSRDDTTNARGGLLGELVPQGYCQSAELDRACFEARLGVLKDPLRVSLAII